MEGLDEEDDYMRLDQYFRNGENGSRSTYRRNLNLVGEDVTSGDQVTVLNVSAGGVAVGNQVND